MDESNLSDLRRLHRSRPHSKAQVMLFGTWSGHDEAEEVDDPYYGGADGFEDAYQQCSRFSKNFLAKLLQDREEDSQQSPLPEP
jgi:low molecular weight phosphotyrosine protein phosphatase